ncbi:MAG: FMN reductase [Pusillimonas sp.]
MPQALNVIAVSGSVFSPSRTLTLVQALIKALEDRLDIDSQVIQLEDIARHTGKVFARHELPAHIDAKLRSIESADLLIVGTPVYRGSLSGQLKHVFDLIDQNALIDTPVLLAATGGSDRHALIIDHQMRPLFSFFQALTLPIGVYASSADYNDYEIESKALLARILLAADRAGLHFPTHARTQATAQYQAA